MSSHFLDLANAFFFFTAPSPSPVQSFARQGKMENPLPHFSLISSSRNRKRVHPHSVVLISSPCFTVNPIWCGALPVMPVESSIRSFQTSPPSMTKMKVCLIFQMSTIILIFFSSVYLLVLFVFHNFWGICLLHSNPFKAKCPFFHPWSVFENHPIYIYIYGFQFDSMPFFQFDSSYCFSGQFDSVPFFQFDSVPFFQFDSLFLFFWPLSYVWQTGLQNLHHLYL